jgi:hypothetical protein
VLAASCHGLLRIAFEMTQVERDDAHGLTGSRLFLETALLAYPRQARVACREFEKVLAAGLRLVEIHPSLYCPAYLVSREEELLAFLSDLRALGRAASRMGMFPYTEPWTATGRTTAEAILKTLAELGTAAAKGP